MGLKVKRIFSSGINLEDAYVKISEANVSFKNKTARFIVDFYKDKDSRNLNFTPIEVKAYDIMNKLKFEPGHLEFPAIPSRKQVNKISTTGLFSTDDKVTVNSGGIESSFTITSKDAKASLLEFASMLTEILDRFSVVFTDPTEIQAEFKENKTVDLKITTTSKTASIETEIIIDFLRGVEAQTKTEDKWIVIESVFDDNFSGAALGDENILEKGYNYLKTLPEFSDAVDM